MQNISIGVSKCSCHFGAFVQQTNQLGETATYSVTAMNTAEHALRLTAQPGVRIMSIDVSRTVFHT